MHDLAAIVFDLFHTLVDLRSAVPGSGTPEILGIDPVLWSRKVVEESPHHALGTVVDPYESVRRIAHAIDPGIPPERIRQAVAARPGRFRAALIHVRPVVLESLRRLRGRGLKLGLISNAALDEVASWEESPLAPLFEAALFSCREGIMKPDVEMYHRAARRLGVPPGQCLYVGDGGSQEHDGARRAGMRTALLLGMLRESYPEIAAGRPRNTDWELESFEDLEGLTDQLLGRGI